MNLRKTYKFCLYPSKQTEQKLLWTLDKCRIVYNYMLEGLNKQDEPNRLELQAMLPKLKQQYPELKNVHSKTLQYETYRLFSNLWALAQLKKKGKKVGKLRFKAKGVFKTFTYNQSGFKIVLTGKRCQILHLSKIGNILIRMHRTFKGATKQITIKRYKSGKWFAMLSVEQKNIIKPHKIRKAVGIDLGLTNIVTDSKNRATCSPQILRKSLKKLRRGYQRFSRTKRRSNNRERQRVGIARTYERISNQRDDFLHKLSYAYVKAYDFIAVEDLRISNMVRNHYLAQSIMDTSWSRFIQMLSYKAENAGKIVVKVEPRNTSQKCSQCGELVRKSLAVRTHKCPYCKAELGRDYNASLNILSLGLEMLLLQDSDRHLHQKMKNYRRNCGKLSLFEIEPIPKRQALIRDAGSPLR